MATVLVLEKDPLQLELLVFLLKRDRHLCLPTTDPDQALSLVETSEVDLILAETALARHDGYRVCQQLRQVRPEIPLIIVSERGAEDDVVRGLRAGADDYIIKPYSLRELLARVQSVLRRAGLAHGAWSADGRLVVGEIALNVHQAQLLVNGHRVHLTQREVSLLYVLMANGGRILSREQLMRLAWEDFAGGAKAVDVVVQRLRQKLSARLRSGVEYIHAERGLGYRFEKPRVLVRGSPDHSRGRRTLVLRAPDHHV